MAEKEITVELTRVCSECGIVVVDLARTKEEKENLYKQISRPTKCMKCTVSDWDFPGYDF